MLAGRYRLALVGGLILLFIGLVAVLGLVPFAQAAPARDEAAAGVVYVTTTDDETTPGDGVCSLREALRNQPDCGNIDIVWTVWLSPTTYVLTDTAGGALSLLPSANLTIKVLGGNAVIQGTPGWHDRILSINVTSTVVSISNVIVRDGNAGAAGGGGIYNAGTLSLMNCQIVSNTASSFGGGILNVGALLMIDTQVMSNTLSGDGSSGGGIYTNKQLTVSNSAIVSNTALGQGGGIFAEGSSAFAILKNVTLSGNVADDGGGMFSNNSKTGLSYATVYSNTTGPSGGGIASTGATMGLTSTIVAGNNGGSGSDCSGNIASNGNNLIQSNCGVITTTGDLTDLDPFLGPLQDNGGPTLTHALADGSPALDHIPAFAGGCRTTVFTDQRGFLRPQGDGCDIGAYESGVALCDSEVYLPLVLR